MKLIDVNILLYATNKDDPRHEKVLRWWDAALADPEPIGLCWFVVVAFLRIATNRRVMLRPVSVADAVAQVDAWLAHPNIQIVSESAHHWSTLSRLASETGATGNLISDAHLAALAVDVGCRLASCDTDFARFSGLRWLNPLTAT